ncbi:PAS domain-containing sensor histidine kinase [Undibacterium jejuense]|uniref:PAS domain-containing sensor histidine kinase n=1 Tax=Undibacterium jejuense TaxID=1344949 RepID=A0A923HG51_9BURK|nr:PAS domain-containing sensor histidine kinase [Undibacterium jejuense]MBC3863124.1 PAS domain-containing sensor histidine kinase [Undibacterium jejuense]
MNNNEQELQSNLKRFSGIVASAKDGIITIDSDHKIIYVNAAATMFFGYGSESTDEAMLGMNLDQIIPGRHRENHNQHVKNFGKTGVSIREMGANFEDFYVTGLKKNGQEFPIEASISSFTEGEQRFYTVIFRDITERKIAKQKLDQYHQELSNLTRSIQTAREEERKHIARELHDNLGQLLAALRIDLHFLRNKQSENTDAVTHIDGMDKLILKSIASLRQLASDLRPNSLDEGGLFFSLRALSKEFTQRHLINCQLIAVEDDLNFCEETSTTIYRIVQESLSNIARHAYATHVDIELVKNSEGLYFKIADNGIGISHSDLNKKQSFGLIGMRERVHAVKGELKILNGQPGTIVEIRMPV